MGTTLVTTLFRILGGANKDNLENYTRRFRAGFRSFSSKTNDELRLD